MTEESPGAGEFGVGSRLAGYRLDEEIARGGMAVVYKAYDTRLERPVALKVLAPQLARDEAFRHRFIRESRTAAAVDHPNIIPIFEAGEAGGVLFIAMRYVQGPDVQSLVNAGGPLPVARACHIITQVAAALEAAHSHGLVHRDVKPGNVLLDLTADPDYPGHAYLSDFGLSKRALSASALTSTGQFLGTLDYIAPEQIEARAVDGRTDEYALACSAYTMFTGAPPFVRDESIAVMWAQISAPPPPLTSRRPGLPAAVDAVMAKALAKVPAERYGTCPQFAAALRRACGLPPGPGFAGPAAGPPPREQITVVPPEPSVPPEPPPTALSGPRARYQEPDSPAEQTSPGGFTDRAYPGSGYPPHPGPAYPGEPGRPGADYPLGRGAEPVYPPDEPGYPADQGRHEPEPPGEWGRPEPVYPPPPGRGEPVHPEDTAGPSLLGLPGSWYRDEPRHPEPPEDAGGPPTEGVPPVRVPGGGGGWPAAGRESGGVSRSRWKARASILAGCVAVLAVGGYFLFGRGGGGSTQAAVVLKPPGCTTAVAKAAQLQNLPRHLVTTGGQPFDVATVPGYAFVSLSDGVAVLNTSQATPTMLWRTRLNHAQGEALTPDGRYLLVSDGSGLTVYRVNGLEQGPAIPVGQLTSPGQKHAVEVAVTPDGRFAFVTYQNTAHVGVFNLQRAFTSGFGPADLVGLIPTGPTPIGVAVSPDGHYAYVTSGQMQAPRAGGGVLNVIDVHKAESKPASAVIKTIPAGCNPARVVTTADGQRLWVTAGGSNALLAFSAPKLLSDPQHALLARLRVGPLPLGLMLLDGGSKIVVANSNRDHQPGAVSSLVVVDAKKALSGQPALIGYVQSGTTPRQFAMVPHGNTLLVTNTDSAQLEAVDISHLP